MRSVELFAGAGGLGIGISNAGFQPEAVIEWNKYACDTIRENQRRKIQPVTHWPLFEGDVRNFDYSGIQPGLELISGGPPCQPFSMGGKHGGNSDERDMFPQAIRAIRELQPRAFLFENVKGLLRESFAKYFGYILLQLNHPELTKKEGEEWLEHLARIEEHHTHGHYKGLHYNVVFRLINAADYGVPQRRERVIIVGFRSDQERAWSFPEPTHSQEALLWDQWVTGDYWERHKIAKKHRPEPADRQKKQANRMGQMLFPPEEAAWLTVRDAISDLPDPETGPVNDQILNHRLNPGARSYAGHTGSPMDEAAKTLKAGAHGVPGGENMLAYHDGRVRYFTVRESARLQTFPDNYIFHGAWGETMRQLGNAVPVLLAETMANSVKKCLSQTAPLLATR